jgi:23S rRNA-/tRNA-specific pseudouridylate synthase
MNAYEWVMRLNKGVYGFSSTENPNKKASNSEIRRWFEKGSIVINGKRVKKDDEMTEPIHSCVFHPNGKHRCTIF